MSAAAASSGHRPRTNNIRIATHAGRKIYFIAFTSDLGLVKVFAITNNVIETYSEVKSNLDNYIETVKINVLHVHLLV